MFALVFLVVEQRLDPDPLSTLNTAVLELLIVLQKAYRLVLKTTIISLSDIVRVITMEAAICASRT